MSWWDYSPNPFGPSNAERDRYRRQSQEALNRWFQQQQQAETARDSKSIFGKIGGVLGDVTDQIGETGEGLIETGLKGLDWYDENVVGPVWDNVVLPSVYGLTVGTNTAFGKETDPMEKWKYENLDGWARMAAGLTADPLTYVGGLGAAAKGLKVASRGARMEKAARIFAGVEKGANIIDDAQAAVVKAPFQAAGKILQGTGVGLKANPVTGPLAREFFGTMGRDTADHLAQREAVSSRLYVGHALQEIAKVDVSSMDGPTAREAAGRLLERGDAYFSALRRQARGEVVDAADLVPLSSTQEQAYRYLRGGGTPTSKRVFEQGRRIATGTSKRPVKYTDELRDSIDDIVRRTIYHELDDRVAVGMLAEQMGNPALATRILMEDADALASREFTDLTQWLERRRTAPVNMLDSLDSEHTASHFLDSLSTQTYQATRNEISAGTAAARKYMGNFGTAAETWDPVYRRFWTNGMDRYLIRPMTEMILGFPFFVVGNVIEDMSMATLGGGSLLGKTKWRVSTDEFWDYAYRMGPDWQVPSSLFEGASKRTGKASNDLSFSLQGARDDGGLSKLNEGVGGVVFGGRLLKAANTISGDIRRAYYLKRLAANAERYGMDAALAASNPAWKQLPDGLRERARMGILLSQGDASITKDLLRQQILSGGTETTALRNILLSGNLPEGAGRDYLLENVESLANPVTRERTLKEGYTRMMRDVSNNMEKVAPLVTDFVEDVVKSLDSITDADELAAFYVSFNDADRVLDQFFTHYRTEAARLASSKSKAAQHAYNLEFLKKAEKLQARLQKAQSEGLPKLIAKLKATGILNDEGVEALTSLAKVQTERYALLRTRQNNLLRLRQSYEFGSTQYFNAEQQVYNKFSKKLLELEKRRDDLLSKPFSDYLNTRPRPIIGGGSDEAEMLPGFRGHDVTVTPSRNKQGAGAEPFAATLLGKTTTQTYGGWSGGKVKYQLVRRISDGTEHWIPEDEIKRVAQTAQQRVAQTAQLPADPALRTRAMAGKSSTARAGIVSDELLEQSVERENRSLATIKAKEEALDRLIGQRAAKGEPVVVELNVGGTLDDQEYIADFLRRKSRLTKDFPNVSFKIEGEGAAGAFARKTAQKAGIRLSSGTETLRPIRMSIGSGRGRFDIDSETLQWSRRASARVNDRRGRAQAFKLDTEQVKESKQDMLDAVLKQQAQGASPVRSIKPGDPGYQERAAKFEADFQRLRQAQGSAPSDIPDFTERVSAPYAGGEAASQFADEGQISNFRNFIEDFLENSDDVSEEALKKRLFKILDANPEMLFAEAETQALKEGLRSLRQKLLDEVPAGWATEEAERQLERYLRNSETRTRLLAWAGSKQSEARRRLVEYGRPDAPGGMSPLQLKKAATGQQDPLPSARGASTSSFEVPQGRQSRKLVDSELRRKQLTTPIMRDYGQVEDMPDEFFDGTLSTQSYGQSVPQLQSVPWDPEDADLAKRTAKFLFNETGEAPTTAQIMAHLEKMRANSGVLPPTTKQLTDVVPGDYSADALSAAAAEPRYFPPGTLETQAGGGGMQPPKKPPVAEGGEQMELFPDMDPEDFMVATNPDPVAIQVAVAISDEIEAREIAARSHIGVQAARDSILEERATQMLTDENLTNWDSIFAGVANKPEKLGALHEEAHQRYQNLARILEHSDRYRGASPEVQQALDAVLEEAWSVRNAMEPAARSAEWKKVFQKTNEEYHRWFTNYDDGRTIHSLMRHAFPFWRYELQRFPRLGSVAARHPWFITNYYRFIQSSGDGQVTIPGTNARFVPAAGGLFNQLSKLMADGGYVNPFRESASPWENIRALMVSGGFIPGPAYAVPASLVEGQPGNELPTTLDMTLSAAEGFGPPGISDLANRTRGLLPSSFDQYSTDLQLVDQGVHPFKATEEQIREAQKRQGRSNAIGQFTGQMVRTDPTVRKDMLQEQAALARQMGIPEELIADAVKHRRNPLEATQNGTRILDDRTLSKIREENPDWEMLKALSSSFASPQERAAQGERFKTFEAKDAYQHTIEAELMPSYLAFQQGDITGAEFRERRKAALDKLAGVQEFTEARYPTSGKADTRAQKKDIMRDLYYSIEPEQRGDGSLDYDGMEKKRAALLAALGATKEDIDYITRRDDRWQSPFMNEIEGELSQAQSEISQYYNISEYPGLTGPQVKFAEQGLQLLERIRKNAPQLTRDQALAVLARNEPVLALYAKKALTIQSSYRKKNAPPTPRKMYWEEHPLLEKFYG